MYGLDNPHTQQQPIRVMPKPYQIDPEKLKEPW
jgi:hypothetical protein